MNQDEKVSQRIMRFLNKYPSTLAFRVNEHAKILERHINPDEDAIYLFCGQKNARNFLGIRTYVAAITTDRLLIASKRLLPGYDMISITPDMFNDLSVESGFFWGKIKIDTIKELVVITHLSKKALSEIETAISQYMLKKKKEYKTRNEFDK